MWATNELQPEEKVLFKLDDQKKLLSEITCLALPSVCREVIIAR